MGIVAEDSEWEAEMEGGDGGGGGEDGRFALAILFYFSKRDISASPVRGFSPECGVINDNKAPLWPLGSTRLCLSFVALTNYDINHSNFPCHQIYYYIFKKKLKKASSFSHV